MKEITITKANFTEEVVNSEKPVLVDFWASWCGPCQMLSPIVSQIAEERADTLKVGKINVDEENELASLFGIESIPTLILFNNGKPTATLIGFRPKASIEEILP